MAGAVFNGDYIKLLKNKLKLAEDAHVVYLTSDPTSVAINAPKGSIAIYDQYLFIKTDAGSSTNWIKMGQPATGLTYGYLQWNDWARFNGSAKRNYIIQCDAEDTTGITSWNPYDDGASATPVDGTGGSKTIGHTLTASATAPLAGSKSLLITKPGSDCQGEGWAYDFTICNADKNQMFYLSGEYEPDATYVVDTYKFYMIDLTASTVTEMKGSAGNGRITLSAALSSNTLYRFCIHCASDNTIAMTMKLDTLCLGPDKLIDGDITYSGTTVPTGSAGLGTLASANSDWQRCNEYLFVKFRFTTGTTAGTVATLNLPIAGITISTTGNTVAGHCFSTATTPFTMHVTAANGASVVGFVSAESASGTALNGSDIGNSKVVDGWYQVKIAEWINQTALLSTTEMMNVTSKVYAYRATNQTGVNPNNSSIKINIDTISTSSGDNAFSTSGYKYTVPRAGWYFFNGSIVVGGTNVVANVYNAVLGINGTVTTYGQRQLAAASNGLRVTISDFRYFNKGDYLELMLYGAGDNSSNTLTVIGAIGSTYLQIFEIPDLSVYGVYGQKEYKSAASSAFALNTSGYATGEYAQMTGNSITLTTGEWLLTGNIKYIDGDATTTRIMGTFGLANGDNTNSVPTSISSIKLDSQDNNTVVPIIDASNSWATMPVQKVRVTADTTVYLNILSTFSNAGTTASVTVYPYAERIQ